MKVFLLTCIMSMVTICVLAQEQAILMGVWSDSTLIASNAHNNTYNEVWGLINEGREYAVIGSTQGTHFIDVTDPTDPQEVFLLEGETTGPSVIHRDYHDYAGYLYAVCDEGPNSTLQIVDYSYLPDSVVTVYNSKLMLRRAHNIFIDTAAAIMYGCITAGDTLPFTPLRLFDLKDPTAPIPIAQYNDFDGFRVSQVHDMYIRNNIAYLNCGPSGFVIADFSDPSAPVTLATLSPFEYVQSGYNHSGWLSDDGQTYFMADENHGADIKVMDVSDLPDISLIDTIDAGSASPFSIPHNQIVYRGLLFVSYYYDGLQVYTTHDPNNIKRVAEFSTSQLQARQRYEGAWGVYPFLPSGNILVSDMQEGLFVLQLPFDLVSTQENESLQEIHVYPNPTNGSFSISGIEDYNKLKMQIMGLDGQLIKALEPKAHHNLNLSDGVYFLRIIDEDILYIKKLIFARY